MMSCTIHMPAISHGKPGGVAPGMPNFEEESTNYRLPFPGLLPQQPPASAQQLPSRVC